jgi:hypothetical protein
MPPDRLDSHIFLPHRVGLPRWNLEEPQPAFPLPCVRALLLGVGAADDDFLEPLRLLTGLKTHEVPAAAMSKQKESTMELQSVDEAVELGQEEIPSPESFVLGFLLHEKGVARNQFGRTKLSVCRL